MIFDTNVLIYISKYKLDPAKILQEKAAISVITKIEALGYAFANNEEHNLLNAICSELEIIPLTDTISEETIKLRTLHKVKLPDAIIYATALVQGVPLLTNNIADFKSLHGNVELINPFML